MKEGDVPEESERENWQESPLVLSFLKKNQEMDRREEKPHEALIELGVKFVEDGIWEKEDLSVLTSYLLLLSHLIHAQQAVFQSSYLQLSRTKKIIKRAKTFSFF